MIVNYDSSVVNKFAASLTDDVRVIIYDRNMFIVQTTDGSKKIAQLLVKVAETVAEKKMPK